MKVRDVMHTSAECAGGAFGGKNQCDDCCVGRGKKGVKYGCDRV